MSKVPCNKDIVSPDDSKPLSPERASQFRSAIGVGMYMSNDRPDIAYTVRTLSTWLSNPTEHAWQCAQKLAMHLNGTSCYGTLVTAGECGESILNPGVPGSKLLLEICTDSDWSGNKRSRRSMTGGSFYVNGSCIYSTCRVQRCITLSSSEAGYYSLVSGAADGLYIVQILRFVSNQEVEVTLRVDNQAARQLSVKQGCSGKLRHVEGRLLWIQERTARKEFSVKPIEGEREIPAIWGQKSRAVR